MSKSRTNSADTACPYWLGWITDTVFRCEGFVDGTEIRFCFGDREARKSYERAFCNSSWERCPLARAAKEVKYTDDDT